MRIDLNADLGERAAGIGQYPSSFTAVAVADDEALMPYLTSANIACGFHAGDPALMRRTVTLALRHGVAIGAHPGLAGGDGFGRIERTLRADEVEDAVTYQVGALAAIAGAQGAALQHVKVHGALYNMAARDPNLAAAVARATANLSRTLLVFGLAGSALISEAERLGLRTAAEGFADRSYRPDGTLVPRSEPGAVISDAEIVARRALMMVRDREVIAVDGSRVRLEVQTICIHGDTPGAAALAARVRATLESDGVEILPVGR